MPKLRIAPEAEEAVAGSGRGGVGAGGGGREFGPGAVNFGSGFEGEIDGGPGERNVAGGALEVKRRINVARDGAREAEFEAGISGVSGGLVQFHGKEIGACAEKS